MTHKYICIHGHFYQPPRENAWLEAIEYQESAAPFHDWNERINDECYAPNTAARILDDGGFISRIINNYARISFNFGPTLLSWLQQADPTTYQGIQRADQLSQERFGGHGSAMAQVYSHLIMPLCNPRDKETQIIWGIRDFEYRFGRKPEGIWLAETAVDTETLELLVKHGIKFTLLAPRQAKAVRRIGEEHWQDRHEGNINPKLAYRCPLPSGQSINVFFYDGNVSQAVAFEKLLNDSRRFADRILGTFEHNEKIELAHIATDGESYGHHHRFGEMALAGALEYIDGLNGFELTNYAQFLELFPPEWKAQIHENSSWSCVHGVERWRADCGCNTGGNPGWNQAWRKPLRETLDWLRDEIIPIFEHEAGKLVKDPWAARNDYIDIILDRGLESIEGFIEKHARASFRPTDRTQLLRLMEMQRQAMQMFTSCGWFFDEVSGIETNQILQYALRAIYYANQVGGVQYHDEFKRRLAMIPSNVYESGLVAYEKQVIPSRVDLERVGMHYATKTIFDSYPEEVKLFKYLTSSKRLRQAQAGSQKLSIGHLQVKSGATLSEKELSFAALYLGQHNIIGKISVNMDPAVYEEMETRLMDAFKAADLGPLIDLMQYYFGMDTYSIHTLFSDERREVLKEIMDSSLQRAERAYRYFYENNYQLMRTLATSDVPIPSSYKGAATLILNQELKAYFKKNLLEVRDLKRLATEFNHWEVKITDKPGIRLTASDRILYEVRLATHEDGTLKNLQNLIEILEVLETMGVELDIWKVQNLYVGIMKEYEEEKWVFSSDQWQDAFFKLGELLKVRVGRVVVS